VGQWLPGHAIGPDAAQAPAYTPANDREVAAPITGAAANRGRLRCGRFNRVHATGRALDQLEVMLGVEIELVADQPKWGFIATLAGTALCSRCTRICPRICPRGGGPLSPIIDESGLFQGLYEG